MSYMTENTRNTIQGNHYITPCMENVLQSEQSLIHHSQYTPLQNISGCYICGKQIRCSKNKSFSRQKIVLINVHFKDFLEKMSLGNWGGFQMENLREQCRLHLFLKRRIFLLKITLGPARLTKTVSPNALSIS